MSWDPRRRYRWTAELTDGTEVPQVREDGSRRSTSELDFSRVRRFRLEPDVSGYPPIQISVDPTKGERAIKFWMPEVEANLNELREVREVLGIQKKTASGESVKLYVICGAHGDILIQAHPNPDVPRGPGPLPHLWCTCAGGDAVSCLGCEIERVVHTAMGDEGLLYLQAHTQLRSLRP